MPTKALSQEIHNCKLFKSKEASLGELRPGITSRDVFEGFVFQEPRLPWRLVLEIVALETNTIHSTAP